MRIPVSKDETITVGVLIDDQKSVELHAVRTQDEYGDPAVVVSAAEAELMLTEWRNLDQTRRRFVRSKNGCGADHPPDLLLFWYTEQTGLGMGAVYPFFDGTSEHHLYQLATFKSELPEGMLKYGAEIGEDQP